MHQDLVTSSTEDGLDFACNLAVSGISAIAEHNPAKAPALLPKSDKRYLRICKNRLAAAFTPGRHLVLVETVRPD